MKINLDGDNKKLLINFFSLSVLQIVSYILPLFTIPYLLRIIGVEKFGLITFAQSFIFILEVIVDYGFRLRGAKDISVYRNNRKKLSEIFTNIILLKFFLIFIVFIFLNLLIFNYEEFKDYWVLFELTFLWLIGKSILPDWFFQGMENMKYITIINISSRLIFVILVFLFIKEANDYFLVPLFNGLGYLIGGIFSFFLVKKLYKIKIDFYFFKPFFYLKSNFQFFLSRIAVSIYTHSNTLVLGFVVSHKILGYYAIAERLYYAIIRLYGPINNVLYPYVAYSKNITKYKKIFIAILLLSFFILLNLYFFAPHIIKVMAGKYLKESIDIFRMFILVMLVSVPSTLVGYPLLAAIGYQKIANYSVVIASLIHLLLLIIFYFFEKLDIFNIVKIILITELVVFFIRFRTILKFNLLKVNK